MIGLDTNILVRWLLHPDAADLDTSNSEMAIIERTLSQKDASFFVNAIVIAETTWILEQKLRLRRAEVCDVIDRLLYSVNITVGEANTVKEARSLYESSNIGFADCLIAGINRSAGCSYTLTFDKKAGRHAGFHSIRAKD